jgi:hypothetical protein
MRSAINLGIRDADVSVLQQFEAEGIKRDGYSHKTILPQASKLPANCFFMTKFLPSRERPSAA